METYRLPQGPKAHIEGPIFLQSKCSSLYGPYRDFNIFAQELFRLVFCWMPIYRGVYGNLQVAIWIQWQGKACHKAPIARPIFSQSKFSGLYFFWRLLYRVSYRLPYGHNGKKRLSIRPRQNCLYFSKGNFEACIFLDVTVQGPLWKHIGCHMGPMATEGFP